MRFPEFNEEWNEKGLGEVCEINPKNQHLPNTFIYIDLESVTNGVLLKQDLIEKNQAPSRAQRILKRMDILFQIVRPYQKNNLHFNLEGDYVASTGYAQLRTEQNSEFIFQYLHHQKFVDKVIERCTGTSYPAINSTDLSDISISIPNIPEQKKIADFLALIDTRIQTQSKIIKELELLKSTISRMIFTQQIRFKDSKDHEFHDWELKKLKEVCEVIGGGTPETNKSEYWNGEIQWFTPTEIKNNHVSTSERTITLLGLKNSSAKMLPKGAILLTTRATIGEVAIALEECTTNQGFQSLVTIGDNNNVFIFNWIKNNRNELIKRANGSTFSEISKSEIEEIEISIPSTQEQTIIAGFFALMDEKIETEKIILKRHENRKKYLLGNLFI